MSQNHFPNLHEVDWLAKVLKVSKRRAYLDIQSKKVPEVCVVRIGKRIRLNEDLVNAWVSGRLHIVAPTADAAESVAS